MNTPYRDLVEVTGWSSRERNRSGRHYVRHVSRQGNECYCPACRAKFREQTGQEPPVKEDFDSLLWQQWVNFKYRSIEEALLYLKQGDQGGQSQCRASDKHLERMGVPEWRQHSEFHSRHRGCGRPAGRDRWGLFGPIIFCFSDETQLHELAPGGPVQAQTRLHAGRP